MKANEQASHYAFAMTVLARAMEAGEEILGGGSKAVMRRFGKPLSRVILGSDRFELTGTISFDEAIPEAMQCLSHMGVFGDVELLEKHDDKVTFKYSGCIRRFEEYGSCPGKMRSCHICWGLAEQFFRAATGDRKYQTMLDSYDDDSCVITVVRRP